MFFNWASLSFREYLAMHGDIQLCLNVEKRDGAKHLALQKTIFFDSYQSSNVNDVDTEKLHYTHLKAFKNPGTHVTLLTNHLRLSKDGNWFGILEVLLIIPMCNQS